MGVVVYILVHLKIASIQILHQLYAITSFTASKSFPGHIIKSHFHLQSEVILFCVTCNNEFPTRNKLFDHLKTSGHASALSSNGPHSSMSKSKKDKKKKNR